MLESHKNTIITRDDSHHFINVLICHTQNPNLQKALLLFTLLYPPFPLPDRDKKQKLQWVSRNVVPPDSSLVVLYYQELNLKNPEFIL